jgi:uncharacterized alkaline shock family protein YloU
MAATTSATGDGGGQPTTKRGTIEVLPQAIITLAGQALESCPGVVGIADRHLRYGAAELLPREQFSRGVEVRFTGERIIIDLHLVVEYGRLLPEIAATVITNVKTAVEQMVGLPIVHVNVIIQGLRISETNP